VTKLYRVLTLALLVSLLSACNTDKNDAPFARFGTSKVTLAGGRTLSVLVADTDSLRQQGLSGVTELSGYDGMLFTFQADTGTEFWMKDTKMPLDLAFLGADGTVLQTLTMPICATNDQCQRYGPPSPYRYALEAPAGSFSGWSVSEGNHLIIG